MDLGRGNGVGSRRTGMVLTLCLGWAVVAATSAGAGIIPRSNFRVRVPAACHAHPGSRACIDGLVYWLDRARASLHQGPYRLPSNFASLPPDRQVFILVNLDRIQYGRAPVKGLTKALDRSAHDGVRHDHDPLGVRGWGGGANWAGGPVNMVLAYELWMYDDGQGTGNIDCTPANHSGCWGHRRVVLQRLKSPYPTAMGASAGRDTSGFPSYAILVGVGISRSFHPSFYYTWKQAVADGAGKNRYVVHRP
ncbi:MAG TPA: hypothetical protein VGF70_05260 [Solirubrobacteraceae bacterium]